MDEKIHKTSTRAPYVAFNVVLGLVYLGAGPASAGPSFTGLGFLPGASSSRASGISANGTVVIGYSGTEAFRWSAATGMVGLGDLPGVGVLFLAAALFACLIPARRATAIDPLIALKTD